MNQRALHMLHVKRVISRRPPPSLGDLRKTFTYDPATGFLTRYGATKHCGAGVMRGRYVSVRLNRKIYAVHRLAWYYVHGEWPDVIDHINGDKSDNRLCNLRNVTQSVNVRAAGSSRKSTSGVRGVSRHTNCRSRWRAYINVDGRRIDLGIFGSVEEAAAARRDAEARINGVARDRSGIADPIPSTYFFM